MSPLIPKTHLWIHTNQLFITSVDHAGRGGKSKDYADIIPVAQRCYNIQGDTVSFYHERGFMSLMYRKSMFSGFRFFPLLSSTARDGKNLSRVNANGHSLTRAKL
jgi:hypothetical protein